MSVREHLLDLIKSIVEHPSVVTVTVLESYPFAFQVKVSAHDHQMVLARLDVIRTLVSTYAGLPESQRIFIQLLPV